MRTPLIGSLVLALIACQSSPEAAQDLAAPPDLLPAAYSVQVLTGARISSRAGAPDFHRARAEIDLKGGPFAEVLLIADLDTTCFPFEKWQQNRPPAGQNWPADCDAFDRNFEFTLDEPQGPGDPPALELVRAITPFGGPMQIQADITDVANGLPGKHTLTVTIPTYADGAGKVTGSDGGWSVRARLLIRPGPAPRKVLAVRPLFNLSHGGATQAKDYLVDVPPGTVRSRLEYRATGHGGDTMPDMSCGGPAEEFCHRFHTVTVDGTDVERFDAWRNDCRNGCTQVTEPGPSGAPFTYCKENPCGLIASVRASRANWCPGSVTPPRTWDVPALRQAGKHTVRYAISKVAAGGSWRLSGVYFAFGD